MGYKVNVGDSMIPFTLKDQEGNTFSSDELFDAPCILYFYPKDDTPGCTKQACTFRDALEEFNEFTLRVIGISPDSVESHKAFTEKYNLNFTLLSDEDHKVASAYDVWKEKSMAGKTYMGIERTTFLIDMEGIIRWIDRPVQVEGHIERVLNAVEKYGRLETTE